MHLKSSYVLNLLAVLIGTVGPFVLTGPAAMAEPVRAALPPPHQTPSAINFGKVIGWAKGATPKAPPGFFVS
ncbi:MAG: hypothetical protein ACAI44_08065, partial [Candidatus Sericytochromatia bacterium]